MPNWIYSLNMLIQCQNFHLIDFNVRIISIKCNKFSNTRCELFALICIELILT